MDDLRVKGEAVFFCQLSTIKDCFPSSGADSKTRAARQPLTAGGTARAVDSIATGERGQQ